VEKVVKDDRLFAPFPIEMDEHPKIIGLTDAAFRAVFEATFYSRRMLSDGFLDERIVLRKWGQPVADELSSNDPERPSWIRVEHGWRIHDFEKHHPLRAEIQAKRDVVSARRSEAGKLGAQRRWDGKAMAKEWQSDGKAMANDSSETETETETSNKSFSSEVAVAPIRPEVESLLDLLDAEILANGGKRPSRTKKNTDAMRLLIDRDKCTPEQVATAIKWCQADEFWRVNILSASKLRAQYDRLRLEAQRKRTGQGSRPTPTDKARAILDLDYGSNRLEIGE